MGKRVQTLIINNKLDWQAGVILKMEKFLDMDSGK
jgi:hypothetical protein